MSNKLNRAASSPSIQEVASFLLAYSSAQLAAGGQTMRVARTMARLAECFGYTCHATFFSRHVTMTVMADGQTPVTLVGSVPNAALNFRQLVILNHLSWLARDNNLSLAEVNARFISIMAMPRYWPFAVLLGASIANTAFCRLFGGDIMAMLLVFCGTFIAQAFRQQMNKRHSAPCLSFMLAAFVASFLVAFGTKFDITATPQIAIGSSVLFLIPGVPMINSTLDLLTGFPLMAFSRLVRSGMLVCSIGIGLGATLFITGLEMEPISASGEITNLWLDLLFDGCFAAMASMGFAMLSNPGRFVIAASGILGALGHAFRFYLLHNSNLGIIPASLLAALLIGTGCVLLAKHFHIPGEFFSFLALLPMIPGMYAYGAILATINFMTVEPLSQAMPYLVAMMRDFLFVLFILCSLALGAITPLLAQHLFSTNPSAYQRS